MHDNAAAAAVLLMQLHTIYAAAALSMCPLPVSMMLACSLVCQAHCCMSRSFVMHCWMSLLDATQVCYTLLDVSHCWMPRGFVMQCCMSLLDVTQACHALLHVAHSWMSHTAGCHALLDVTQVCHALLHFTAGCHTGLSRTAGCHAGLSNALLHVTHCWIRGDWGIQSGKHISLVSTSTQQSASTTHQPNNPTVWRATTAW